MNRRDFLHTTGGVMAGVALGSARPAVAEPSAGAALPLKRIGLELWSVRKAMAKDFDRTLAAVRQIGYTDVELLWSMNNFGKSTAEVKAALQREGLRAPSAHISPLTILIGWEKRLDAAKALGHEYLIVPSFTDDTSQTLDQWREWADHFNKAGAVARKHGLWLAFHNEAEHMKPIDGKIPYDIFVDRTDPSVVRHQFDIGNMVIGGGDPMHYLQKYKDRYWSFHIKDVVADRSTDTELGKGTVNFKQLLSSIPNIDAKPCYVEQEGPADPIASVKQDFEYLKKLS
jgi:sugar phosphate isomerase/epimerase